MQADKKFLGGKQVQRAIEFFKIVMIDSLPDPYELKDKVANVTGYLNSGLQRENWEHAMVQIIKVCVKEVSHPGVNYLIKHVGNIFRRLFTLALDDVKTGEENSATFQLLPSSVENCLISKFEETLWNVMHNAADKTHCALEPMYSTVDPHLPTFSAQSANLTHQSENTYTKVDDQYIKVASRTETMEASSKKSYMDRVNAIISKSGEKAKDFLRKESVSNAMSKKSFLQDERTSMITDEETDKILQRSFEYIVALIEVRKIWFQVF